MEILLDRRPVPELSDRAPAVRITGASVECATDGSLAGSGCTTGSEAASEYA